MTSTNIEYTPEREPSFKRVTGNALPRQDIRKGVEKGEALSARSCQSFAAYFKRRK